MHQTLPKNSDTGREANYKTIANVSDLTNRQRLRSEFREERDPQAPSEAMVPKSQGSKQRHKAFQQGESLAFSFVL